MFLVIGIDNTPVTASFKIKDDEFNEITSHKGFKLNPTLCDTNWCSLKI